jgi:hypothetical protein
MGFALVTAVGWGLNWPVPKYLLTELPLLSTLKQGTIDAFALSSPTSDVAVRDLGAAYLIDIPETVYSGNQIETKVTARCTVVDSNVGQKKKDQGTGI